MDAVVHADDGTRHNGQGQIHDPAIDAWHILWSDPLRQFYARQTGRAVGNDIVQEGTSHTGNTIRWTFTDITPDSFRWLGERLAGDGKSWQLQAEFRAKKEPLHV